MSFDNEGNNISPEVPESDFIPASENETGSDDPPAENQAAESEDVSAENGVTPEVDNTADSSTTNGYRRVYTEPWCEPIYGKTPADTGHVYSPNYSTGHVYGYQDRSDSHPETVKKEKSSKPVKHTAVKVIALILACVLLSSIAAAITTTTIIKNSNINSKSNKVILGSPVNPEIEDSSSDASDTANNKSVKGPSLSANEIYNKSLEQVVCIYVSGVNDSIFGKEMISGGGCGFIISEDGYILTNYHVISSAVEEDFELSVAFHDGTTYEGKVINYSDDNDVAVIKIDASGLKPVTFGNTDDVVVGQPVYVVGNPTGVLAYTITSGIVSALDRDIPLDSLIAMNMFQIDAAVNNGNSGGPVYDEHGNVIGIVTAKSAYANTEGLGFAIPINDAVKLAAQIIENGYVSKAQLGITVSDVDQMVSSVAAEYWGIPNGAWVQSVNSGSGAEKAGLKSGDIIISINDITVESTEDLVTELRNYSVGDTVTVTVFRMDEDKTLEYDVVLSEAANEISVSD